MESENEEDLECESVKDFNIGGTTRCQKHQKSGEKGKL